MRVLIPILLFALMTATPGWAASDRPTEVKILADGPAQLNFGLGIFNFANGGDNPAAARIEWRFGKKAFRLGPLLGLLVNADDGLFVYGGVHLDIAWRQLVLTPQTSIGAYCQGEGKDLGGTLQFRSALELAWRAAGGSRVGVQVGHISNAHLHHRNAGENDIFLTLALPF